MPSVHVRAGTRNQGKTTRNVHHGSFEMTLEFPVCSMHAGGAEQITCCFHLQKILGPDDGTDMIGTGKGRFREACAPIFDAGGMAKVGDTNL